MFIPWSRGKSQAAIISNPVSGHGPINDTSAASQITFPVGWIRRVQTPITKPPLGKMWGNSEWDNYGGTWSA